MEVKRIKRWRQAFRIGGERQRYINMYEEMMKLTDKLNKSIDAIVVEGRRDLITLRRMGISKEIITAHEIKHRDLRGKRIAVLTDFDSHGEKLNKEISKFIESAGGKVKQVYREMFCGIALKRGVRQIESMRKTLRESELMVFNSGCWK